MLADKLEEGIFRLSENVQNVDDLKKRFNQGNSLLQRFAVLHLEMKGTNGFR